MKNEIKLLMDGFSKKILIILLSLISTISICSANSFSVEGKEIILIDFDGYKHEGVELLAEEFKTINGISLYDVLIPEKANNPAIDFEDFHYNDYFAICVQPKMLFGFDLTTEDFSYFKTAILDSFTNGSNGFDSDAINSEYSDKITYSVEDISEPRLFINEPNCIGFSTAMKADAVDYSILSLSAIALVKGKIIWIYYYDDYSAIIDYEKAVSKCIKFIHLFLDANIEEQPVSEKERLQQYYAALVDADFNAVKKTISSEGYSKALGLIYRLELPDSFIEKASEKPHIVHSFSKEYGDYSFYLSILVDDSMSPILDFMGDDFKVSDYLDELSNYLPANSELINAGKTTIGGLKDAFFIEYYTTQKILDGVGIKAYSYQVISQYDGVATNITMMLGGLDNNDFDLVLNCFKPLILYIISSFRFVANDSSIRSDAAKELDSQISKTVSNILLFSIIIPILLGIAVGLILRYGIVRHPANKTKALVLAVIFGLALVLIAYYEFGGSGSIGVIAGVLFCYLISRLGHAEYDAEMEKIERQKKEASKMFEEASEMHSKAEETINRAKETQKKADRQWEEAKNAKQEAETEKRKAQNASIEIQKLKEELRKVMERNRRLEEEAMRTNRSSSSHIDKNRSYYEAVLDLSSHYSRSELRKAYLEKTMLYHPDKVNALGSKLRLLAEEEMKDINAAYSELQKYCTS